MSRNWAPHVKEVVEKIENEFDLYRRCDTYPGHGDTGEKFGIDIWVANYGQWAKGQQYKLADQICYMIFAKWPKWGCRYVIFQDAICFTGRYSGWGYYDYTQYGGGSGNTITRRHGDHIHLQIAKRDPSRDLESGEKDGELDTSAIGCSPPKPSNDDTANNPPTE